MAKQRKTPPLAWLRAFCEAGRCGSFKQAALALHLSPSTVSHEIRKLEDWVQVPLFSRARAKIELTDEGRRLFHAVGPAFDQLEQAFEQFKDDQSASVRIGMLPYFASEFVVPILDTLNAPLGERSITITSNIHLDALDLAESEQRLDAVVRYAQNAPAGLEWAPLTSVSLGVVIGGNVESRCVDQLTRRVQLEDQFDGWQVMADAGVVVPESNEAPIVVDNYLSAMRAVEHGSAIGIAILPLCEPWLSDGRIRLLSNALVEIPQKYGLVWRKTSAKANALASVAANMRQEFERRAGLVEKLRV